MARRALIDAMRDSLTAAAGARDWDRLAAAVNALAPRIQALAAAGPWNIAELGALERLRSAHALASTVVAEQQQVLAARMGELQDNKTGWSAYARDSQTELDENPA